MRDEVYIVNDLSDYLKAAYKGKTYIFLAGKPVKINYSEDPRVVSYLLECVQLRLATVAELTNLGILREEKVNEKASKSNPYTRTK